MQSQALAKGNKMAAEEPESQQPNKQTGQSARKDDAGTADTASTQDATKPEKTQEHDVPGKVVLPSWHDPYQLEGPVSG